MIYWIIILAAILIIVLVISIVIRLIQDRIIFHPEIISIDDSFNFSNEFEEIFLEARDGVSLNGVWFKLNNPKGIVLYFHNHSGNIKHCSNSVFIFNELNYDVLVMDFRGFGKSGGSFNEEMMYEDAQLWYNYVKQYYDEDQIVLYGRGLGATFATYVASKNNPGFLCLEMPMYDLLYTSKFHYPFLPLKFILKYKLSTAQYFVEVNCKKYLFHGKQDELIPYTNSEKLYNLSKENSELYILPEVNHYNMGSNATYLSKLEEIFTA